jgi:hypothetical protein
METPTKLQYSKTHRHADDNSIGSGIYVMSVGNEETAASIRVETWNGYASSGIRYSLAPEQLRALAADLLTAATFIEENAAQRAVNELTDNTPAQ